MTAVFVTSTGTEIGKTFVTAGLIRHCRKSGRRVESLKPIVTGFDSNATQGSDPAVLLEALGRPITLEEITRISPWRFQTPVAPDLAARREGRSIDFKALTAFCRDAINDRDTLLVEGVGGVMVPLDDRHTVLDWISALRIPVILVAGSYLGTISHTLTALHVLAQRNLSTLALVVNETPGSSVPLDDAADSIRPFADLIDVFKLPRLASDAETHPTFDALAALLGHED